MWGMRYFYKLYSYITDVLFPPANTAELVRAITPETFGRLVSPTLTAQGHTALLPYRSSVVRAVIIEAKFHRNKKAISLLAQVLADYLIALAEDSHSFDKHSLIVIPVPLSRKRYVSRGYNQVAEIVKASNVRHDCDTLVRVRDTLAQTLVSKHQRLTNMKAAFKAQGVFRSNTKYVLVDDVTTTGATLSAGLEALDTAGIHAMALALAH